MSTFLVHGSDYYFNEDEKAYSRLDPAWAKVALFFRTGKRLSHIEGTINARSLERIHGILQVFKQRIDDGDTLAILAAINVCSSENLPLPTWLALVYQERYSRFVSSTSVSSLDQVFCSPSLPTATAKKNATAKQDGELGWLLWDEAWQLAKADESITNIDALVVRVLKTKAWGVKKTKARELILKSDANQKAFLSSNTLSRYLANRRKQLSQ